MIISVLRYHGKVVGVYTEQEKAKRKSEYTYNDGYYWEDVEIDEIHNLAGRWMGDVWASTAISAFFSVASFLVSVYIAYKVVK